MQVEVLMVANAAAVENGLLNVAGAGWERYDVTSFPAQVRGALAGICAFSDEDLGKVYPLRFTVSGNGVEGSTGAVAVTAIASSGTTARAPFEAPFSTVVHGPTVVRVAVLHEAEELAAVMFDVPDTPQAVSEALSFAAELAASRSQQNNDDSAVGLAVSE